MKTEKKKLLLKNVLHNAAKCNILIEGNRFADMDADASAHPDAEVLDAGGLAVLPAFYNTHTHAAMTLLRGYADDMELFKWLNDYIWPKEATLTPDDIEEGSRIAVEEMIRSGTVFFNDMYWDVDRTVKVAEQYGLRACIGVTFMDMHDKKTREGKIDFLRNFRLPESGRISLSVAPHAIYTVGPDLLRQCAELSRELGLRLHIHLSETAKEVEDCVCEHGMTPVRYLDSLGVLDSNVVAAHCVHLDRGEMKILADRKVVISHCPCSNMKLCSGAIDADALLESGCRMTLGTDGASSNNNLDMREQMKFASLLAKHSSGNPESLPAPEIFNWATRNGAEAFGINAGTIEKGKIADCVLVSMDNPKMTPCHNLVSNWVYSADSSIVDSVICDGRVILRGGSLVNCAPEHVTR